MDIESKVLETIRTYLENDLPISANTSFEEINMNSVRFIELTVRIEKEVGMTFEDEKLMSSEFPTVKDLVDYIKERYEN